MRIRSQNFLSELDNSREISNRDSKEIDFYLKFRIQIVDTGVGIKSENLDNLFQNFGKLDEHSKINPTGTGLGLSICKQMID
jgi:signal transduction histidine kinase